MSIKSQFDGGTASLKRDIEAAYDDGSDDVQGTEEETQVFTSPLCVD